MIELGLNELMLHGRGSGEGDTSCHKCTIMTSQRIVKLCRSRGNTRKHARLILAWIHDTKFFFVKMHLQI